MTTEKELFEKVKEVIDKVFNKNEHKKINKLEFKMLINFADLTRPQDKEIKVNVDILLNHFKENKTLTKKQFYGIKVAMEL